MRKFLNYISLERVKKPPVRAVMSKQKKLGTVLFTDMEDSVKVKTTANQEEHKSLFYIYQKIL